jgi:YD repeat-containing protein
MLDDVVVMPHMAMWSPRREEGSVTYTQDFDVENRLITVTEGSNITEFRYDANGQRTMTIQPGGQTTTYYPSLVMKKQ